MEDDPLLFRNLKALNIIGMWPPKDPKFAKIYKVYSLILYIWFTTFTTSQLIEIGYIYNDFKELTANTGVSLLYSVVVAKVYIVIFKKEHVISLVNTIRETEHKILQTTNVKLKNVVRDYILQNWTVTWQFWMLAFSTILLFFIRPPLDYLLIGPQPILFPNGTETGKLKYPLVFSSWFPFNKYNGPLYYLALVFQTVSGTIGASYVGIWDTFIVALMIFAIGQFRVLQCLLQDLYPTGDEMSSEGTDEISVNKRFVECVKHHQLVIKYVKK